MGPAKLAPPSQVPDDHELAGVRSALGSEVRKLRKAKGMSGRALAKEAGITAGFVSQMEQGQVMPSVATLLKVCSALEVAIGELFEVSPGSQQIVKASERPNFSYPEHDFIDELVSADPKGKLQVLFSRIMAGGGSGPELYTHGAETEFVIVLKGALELFLRDNTYSLAEGDACTFAGDIPHGYRNEGAEATEVIWVVTPATY